MIPKGGPAYGPQGVDGDRAFFTRRKGGAAGVQVLSSDKKPYLSGPLRPMLMDGSVRRSVKGSPDTIGQHEPSGCTWAFFAHPLLLDTYGA
jgi:hypothetical protein